MIAYTDCQFECMSEDVTNALKELGVIRKVSGPDYRLDLAIALLKDALNTIESGDEQPATIF